MPYTREPTDNEKLGFVIRSLGLDWIALDEFERWVHGPESKARIAASHTLWLTLNRPAPGGAESSELRLAVGTLMYSSKGPTPGCE